MRNRRKWLTILAALAALSLVAAACGDDDGDGGTTGATGGSTAEDLTGTITISGSSTVQPITSLVAELFNEDVSDGVAFTVDGPGTSDGFVLFCDGETDIQDASRPIEQEEIDACSANGVEYIELAVAFDGITVMTNPANADVTCLNHGDLYALFGPESNGIDTWDGADALANEVGGNGRVPERPARDHRPGRGVGDLRRVHRSLGDRGHRARAGGAGGRGRGPAHRLPAISRRQRDHLRDGGLGFPARLRGLRVRGGCRGPGQDPRGRRWRRVCRPEPRHDRRRLLPAVAHAVHLREQGQARGEPGTAGRSWTTT